MLVFDQLHRGASRREFTVGGLMTRLLSILSVNQIQGLNVYKGRRRERRQRFGE